MARKSKAPEVKDTLLPLIGENGEILANDFKEDEGMGEAKEEESAPKEEEVTGDE